MPQIDLGGTTVNYRCTGYTTSVYENEFKDSDVASVSGDMISDMFGRMNVGVDDIVDVSDDGEITINLNYAHVNWTSCKRALWAMARTDQEIRWDAGEDVPRVPSYEDWDRSLKEAEIDMLDLAYGVYREAQRGLFRSGAATS